MENFNQFATLFNVIQQICFLPNCLFLERHTLASSPPKKLMEFIEVDPGLKAVFSFKILTPSLGSHQNSQI